jgi:hypothetical protein
MGAALTDSSSGVWVRQTIDGGGTGSHQNASPATAARAIWALAPFEEILMPAARFAPPSVVFAEPTHQRTNRSRDERSA